MDDYDPDRVARLMRKPELDLARAQAPNSADAKEEAALEAILRHRSGPWAAGVDRAADPEVRAGRPTAQSVGRGMIRPQPPLVACNQTTPRPLVRSGKISLLRLSPSGKPGPSSREQSPAGETSWASGDGRLAASIAERSASDLKASVKVGFDAGRRFWAVSSGGGAGHATRR